MIEITVPVGLSAEKRRMSMPKLLRDVVVVVIAKLALVIAAAVFVFGPADRPRIDAGGVESHLIGQSTSNSPLRNSTP
jgi:hypothetical protein